MFSIAQTLLRGVFGFRRHLFRVVLFAAFCSVSYANTVELTLLASADLHGNQNLIRNSIAPAVKNWLRESSGNLVYLDVGDCAQGSLELLLKRGSGILPELFRSGCSIFVPGNHELEYGFEAFKKILGEFPGTILAANLHAPELEDRFTDAVIVEHDGVKTAFIGLMLKNMENAFPVAENRFHTLPGKAVLRKTVNKVLAQGADMIVLLRHAGKYGGGENTFDLVKDIPEIDLVIGAHTHRGDAGSMVGNAWYVQPPAHGKALAGIKIVFDRKMRKIKQIKSSFIELGSPGANSVAGAEKVPSWQGKTLDHPSDVIRKVYNADLALYAVNSPAKLQGLLNDPSPQLTDFYQVFPYFDSMITVVVTGGEFLVILREYAKFAHKRKQYLTKSGFSADIVHGKVRHTGSIDRKKSYTLALSAYAAAGAGGNLMETRRILKDKIDYRQMTDLPSLLEVLTGLQSVPQELLK